jgi:acetate kinase
MMRTLVINPGSATLKLSVVDGQHVVAARTLEDRNGSHTLAPAEELCATAGPIEAVGVRIVHGGDRPGPVILDDGELRALEEFVSLAPTHQPRCLAMARLAIEVHPDTPVIGCFDTSFHTGLPDHARTYPVPREWTDRLRLRRFGFHGLSCAFALRRTGGLLGVESAALNLICCHVGSGVSVTAIAGGRSVDTSMGLTPLDGTVMATRPGSLDPGLLLHVLRTGRMSAAEVGAALARRSGLAGMSGTDGDMRRVLAARAAGDDDARLAVAVYLHRLRREIAAARTSLDRLDALVFTGGVAEHQPALRAELAEGLAHLGVAIDPDRDDGVGDRVISPEGTDTRVLVVEAREDLEIGRQVEQAMRHRSASGTPPSRSWAGAAGTCRDQPLTESAACPRWEYQRMGTRLTSGFRVDAWWCRPVSSCSSQVTFASGDALLPFRRHHSNTSRMTAACCRPRRSASAPSTRLISKTTSVALRCCWRRVRCVKSGVVFMLRSEHQRV